VLLGIIVGTLAGFLGRRWWVFDLFSHFRTQYFLILAVVILIFLAGGRYIQAALSAVFALLNLGLILPVYRIAPPHAGKVMPTVKTDHRNPSSPLRYRVLLANVLQRNREYARVEELIRSADPDIIILIEINCKWMDALDPVLKAYPYSLKPLREDNYGLGLFSKFPFASAEQAGFGEAKVPSVLAQLNIAGQPLTVIGTHPPPPKRALLARQRDAQLHDIAHFISTQPGPVMLLGELNITSWSPHFQDLLRLGRLSDSRQGWGIHPSWPVDRPLYQVPIDHILVTEGIAIHRRWRGPYTGSDHYPILIEFSL
jgi:endonuclease/exonuclease/phosphatase (EEP) superfamily protein YafD